MTDKDYLFHADLASLDGDVQRLIQLEEERQSRRIILIPSESLSPAAVREALGSVFSHIYAEGYPPLRMTHDEEAMLLDYGHQLAFYRRYADRRFYKGADYVNFAETLAQRRAAACFANERVQTDQIYVNVQALSGAAANNSIYEAFVQPGDTVMGMNLMHGGHLTHGSQFNRSGKRYRIVSYTVDPKTERLDYDAILKLALEHRPRMIIAGYTSYPWAPDWGKFREIADTVGAVLMADIAHTAGMAIAGVYPSPVGIADVTVFTTHKTLCGPRGAVILTTDEERAARVDNAVFPGEQGGPHVNKFVALAVAFRLAQTPQFKALQRQIVANASALAASLQKRGMRLAYGGTDTHLLLADLRSVKSPTGYPLRGEVAARLLEICGIVVNKNTIPGDDITALASGIRLGTPWVTQRGMREPEMDRIADLIHRVVSDVRPFSYAGLGGELPRGKATLAVLRQVSQAVDELTARFDPQPPKRSAYPHYPLLPGGDSSTSWTADDEKLAAAALKEASLQGNSEGTALLVRGLRAAAFLQEACTANLAALQPGHATQTAILDADGTVMDDVIVVRLAQNARGEDRYCVIANASNAARIKEWLRALSDGYVIFDKEDILRKVQGPVVVEDVPAERAIAVLSRKAPVVSPRPESAPGISGLALYNSGQEALFDFGKPYFVGQASLAPSAPVDALPEFAWQPEEDALKRTPLYDEHRKRTRKLIPFAGWEMPVWYTSVGEEHAAVRNAAGLFDVAHMGVLDVSGPNAASFLDTVSTNYGRWLDPGQSQYAYLLDPDGSVIDDIMIYCLRRDRYFVVVNAANADEDWAWLNAVNEGRVQIDRKRSYVKVDAPAVLRDLKDPRWGADCRVDLALQGPASLSILQTLAKDPRRAAELARIRRTDLLETELAGMPIVVSRTGYTGELVGFELFVHPDNAVRLWNLLLEKGEPFGIKPAGLAARDSTRIEAGLPLYGHELAGDYNVSPIEAGFAPYVKYHKPFFVGRETIMERAQASSLSIARFRVNSSTARAFRGHEPVVNKRGQYIGRVTSCTLVEDAQVGMALVDKRYATPGTEVAIYPTALAKGDKPVAFAEMAKGDQALLPEWCTVLQRFRGAESSVPATAGE